MLEAAHALKASYALEAGLRARLKGCPWLVPKCRVCRTLPTTRALGLGIINLLSHLWGPYPHLNPTTRGVDLVYGIRPDVLRKISAGVEEGELALGGDWIQSNVAIDPVLPLDNHGFFSHSIRRRKL